MLREAYDVIFPFNRVRFSFFLDICRTEGVERVLDAGCGTGDYVLEFFRCGCKAAGVDMDPSMIKLARGKAEKEGLTPSFIQGDIRELVGLFPEGFQLLTCCGNTLAHLTSQQDLSRSLAGMWESLLPGGVLVVQVVNYDRVLKEGITRLPTIEREGLLFERRYSFRPDGLIDFQGTLITHQGEAQSTISLRPLRQEDLQALMEEAGFVDLEFYHDFKYTPFTLEKDAPLGLVGMGKRERAE